MTHPAPPRSSSWSGRYRPYWLQPPAPQLPPPLPPPAPPSPRRTLVLVVAGVLAAVSLLVGGGAAGLMLGRRGDPDAAAAPAAGSGPGIARPTFMVTLPAGWTDRTEWTVPMRQDAYLRTDKVWEGRAARASRRR